VGFTLISESGCNVGCLPTNGKIGLSDGSCRRAMLGAQSSSADCVAGMMGNPGTPNNAVATDGWVGSLGLVHFSSTQAVSSGVIDAFFANTKKFFLACSSGNYGNTCTTTCPAGSYCPGDWERYDCGYTGPPSEQTVINVNYCPQGGAAPVAVSPGFFSYGATSSTRTNQAACTAGHYCAAGVEVECGGSTVYCQFSASGRTAPAACPAGYYTTGGTATTRDAIEPCPQGHFCTEGAKFPCPAGKFGGTQYQTDAGCSGNCAAGYFCQAGSTVRQADTCGSADVYCPAGTEERQQVLDGLYSTPLSAASSVRTGQLACPAEVTCADGVQIIDLIEWTGECSSGGYTIFMAEDASVGTSTGVAQNASHFVNTETVASYSLTDLNGTGCFELASDRTVALAAACSVPLDYEAVPRAQFHLVLEVTIGADSAICAITVDVADGNDQPALILSSLSQLRQISEKAAAGTTVGNAVMVIDEDVGQEHTFSILGDAVPAGAEALFTISSCSGEVRLTDAGAAALDYNRQS
jgi:hypothetical protein